MKKYFKIGFIHQLTYGEYHSLIVEMLSHIDEEEIKEENILTAIGKLKAHMPKLNYVVERTRLHQNTAKINGIAKKRDQTFSSLVYGIKAGEHAETQEQRNAWRVLNNWLREENKVRRTQNIIRRSAMFSRLNIRLNGSTSLQEALQVLHLTARFEKIMRLTQEIWELQLHRIKDLNAFTDMSNKLRQKSHKDLRVMLRMMEISANIEGEHQEQLDFVCKILSDTMKEHNRSFKFRKTMKKKKDEKAGTADAAEREEEE